MTTESDTEIPSPKTIPFPLKLENSNLSNSAEHLFVGSDPRNTLLSLGIEHANRSITNGS